MEQDEEIICIISKYSNHVSNQYLATQKEKIIIFVTAKDSNHNHFSQKNKK